MQCNKLFRPSVGADYAVSKKTTDDGIGPSTVTLSRSEGSPTPNKWAKGLAR